MSGIAARQTMEDELKRELMGPLETAEPRGRPLNLSTGVVIFETKEDSRAEFHDAETGEEILTQSDPLRRYGVGILHGGGSSYHPSSEVFETADIPNHGGNWSDADIDRAEVPIGEKSSSGSAELDSDNFDLQDANSFKPSALGISFKCEFAEEGTLDIDVSYAYYDTVEVGIPGLDRRLTWWVCLLYTSPSPRDRG